MMQRKSKDYSDIINLPHPVSKKHPQMSLYDRAAQFSPFSALTGHEAAIAETGRLTEERTELDEDAKERLDEKLQYLLSRLQVCGSEELPIRVTYFVPDEKKEGGAYQEYTGSLKRLDAYARALIFSDATEISLDAVYDIAEDTK
jgi:hypothetical protein